MFEFTDKYNLIKGQEIELRLTETVIGEEAFDSLPFYYYDIYISNNAQVGKISFRVGYNEFTIYNGNVGYEINEEYRGNHYSLKALKLLKPLADYHNMQVLFLVVDQGNIPSNKIAALAQGKLIGKFQVEKGHLFYVSDGLVKNVYLVNINEIEEK